MDVCLKLIGKGIRLFWSAMTSISVEGLPALVQTYEILMNMIIKVWPREQFLH